MMVVCIAVISIAYLFYSHKLINNSSDEVTNQWVNVGQSIEYQRYEYNIHSYKGVLDIYKLKKDEYHAELVYDKNARSIKDWKSDSNEIILNGCFFEKDYSPSGYLILNSQVLSSNIFDQASSGLLTIDEKDINIQNLSKEPIQSTTIYHNAFQSFPLLMDDNQIGDVNISPNQARRSAIGIDYARNIYLIISNEGNLSLENFAKVLKQSGITFDTVLNLDGGPSAGIYVKTDKYTKLINSKWKVPNVIRFQKS